jgi:hypothetical protein
MAGCIIPTFFVKSGHSHYESLRFWVIRFVSSPVVRLSSAEPQRLKARFHFVAVSARLKPRSFKTANESEM